MHKIKLLYDALGWAHWKRCQVLKDYAPPEFKVDIGRGTGGYSEHHYDLYLQLCCGHVRAIRKHLTKIGHDSILVSGFNVGYNESNVLNLIACLDCSDHVIVNSEAAWMAAGKPSHRTSWISNGVDLRKWKIVTPIADRKPKVLFVGSYFHTEPNVRDTKGYWSILKPLAAELDKRGIDHDFRRVNSCGLNTMSGDKIVLRDETYMTDPELLEWYNTGTVYVVASESEGTPNPCLEAAACGLTACATAVGNMPELIVDGVNGVLVDHTVESVTAGVLRCVENYQEYAQAMQQTIIEWDWARRALDYWRLFRTLLDTR